MRMSSQLSKMQTWADDKFEHMERDAVDTLLQRLDAHFIKACDTLLACTGRIVVTGMGKSGHIGCKLAATLASTGTVRVGKIDNMTAQ